MRVIYIFAALLDSLLYHRAREAKRSTKNEPWTVPVLLVAVFSAIAANRHPRPCNIGRDRPVTYYQANITQHPWFYLHSQPAPAWYCLLHSELTGERKSWSSASHQNKIELMFRSSWLHHKTLRSSNRRMTKFDSLWD